MSYNFSSLHEELNQTSDWLRKEYVQISTGRANPALLDSIQVESYGSHQPIKNIAAITIEESRTLRIAPWDKSQIKAIEKAILESGLPFSVASDSEGLRASIPQLTEENKKTIVKLLKEKLEDARVRARQTRQKFEKDIESKEKAGDFSEDDKFNYKETLQKEIDKTNMLLEEIFTKKEKDLMGIA